MKPGQIIAWIRIFFEGVIRMKQIQKVICILGLILLILDSRTASAGIRDGIELCLEAVIPSIFPFLVICSLLTSLEFSFLSRFLQPIRKVCGIPVGAENIFILGFLSGYPTGAQIINQAWLSGRLEKKDANRMLGFCSNAGPSFIFGICSMYLPTSKIWLLWLIHILSAIITAFLLPGKTNHLAKPQPPLNTSLPDAIKKSSSTMAIICAWIVMFRMFLVFSKKWFHRFLSPDTFCFLCGLLELTNGIFILDHSYPQGKLFIYMATFLAFGGLCVAAQTCSVTKQLGLGYYFPGKTMQSAISFLLSYLTQFFFFAQKELWKLSDIYLFIPLLWIIFMYVCLRYKKTVAFPRQLMYNKAKIST